MEHDYRIEALVSTFEEHAKMNESHQAFVNSVFLEQNPGQELPAHMVNPFNAARAFCTMCAEIKELKNKYEAHLYDSHPDY